MSYRPRIQSVTITDQQMAAHAHGFTPAPGDTLTVIPDYSTGLIYHFNVWGSHGKIGRLRRLSSTWTDRVDWEAVPLDKNGQAIPYSLTAIDKRPTRVAALVDLLDYRAKFPSQVA